MSELKVFTDLNHSQNQSRIKYDNNKRVNISNQDELNTGESFINIFFHIVIELVNTNINQMLVKSGCRSYSCCKDQPYSLCRGKEGMHFYIVKVRFIEDWQLKN